MKNPFNEMSGGEMIAFAAKVLVAGVVIAFLGIQSLNFFGYIFKADQQIYAILGFGLTGGGVVAYLLVLKWGAKNRLEKVVAALMLVLCVIGELMTAGFGMQVEAWSRQGLAFTQSDLDSMIWIVRVLGFVHAVALIAMVAGAEFAEAFQRDEAEAKPSTPAVAKSGRPFLVPPLNNAPVNKDGGAGFTD